MASNPRSQNGNLRRKHRARFKAMGLPCAICGRPIDYDRPSTASDPFSFVIDEKLPVSRWREFGYSSPQAAANDWNNLQPCHRVCNAKKGTKVDYRIDAKRFVKPMNNDGDW